MKNCWYCSDMEVKDTACCKTKNDITKQKCSSKRIWNVLCFKLLVIYRTHNLESTVGSQLSLASLELFCMLKAVKLLFSIFTLEFQTLLTFQTTGVNIKYSTKKYPLSVSYWIPTEHNINTHYACSGSLIPFHSAMKFRYVEFSPPESVFSLVWIFVLVNFRCH